MAGLLIPDDWDEGADGFCELTVTVPNSAIWRANVRGALTVLQNPKQWDAATGDTDTAVTIGQNILDSATYDCPNTALGLVHYWHLDEQSGTRKDSVGTNDLADNNTVLYDTGKIGNSADFVRANLEYLSGSHYVPVGDFSISVWVKVDTLSQTHVVIASNHTTALTGDYAIIVPSNGKVSVFNWRNNGTDTDGVTTTNSALISTSTWYHIVMVWNGIWNTIYVDSVAQPSFLSSTVSMGTAGFRVGRAGGTAYFDGNIDELAIYDRALTSYEVDQIYNGGAGLDLLN